MRRDIVLPFLLLTSLSLLAGCVGDDPPVEDRPDRAAATSDVSRASVDDPDASAPNASSVPSAPQTIPIVLDGNIGSSAVLCVLGPVGECAFVPVEDGVSGMLLEGHEGWVDGGELVLTWEADSPATQELTAGFMLMDGGDGGGEGAEGCDGVELGGAEGPSPLTLTIAPATRPMCAGEILHFWVAGTTFGAQDPAYYQVDVDQAFHVEGAFVLRAPDAGEG